jgi:arylsulfatase A
VNTHVILDQLLELADGIDSEGTSEDNRVMESKLIQPPILFSSIRKLVMFQPLTKTATMLAIVVLASQTTLPQTTQAKDTSRPNVVLIMADDMGYEALSSNGSLDYQTPYLDNLAKQGFRFTHCYSQPICTPTRVKLMTGLSNVRNYMQFGKLARDQKTFGHLFQAAGYKTCIAGKWQLGSEEDAPQHFGFQQALLWQHTRKGNSVDGFDSRYPNPRLEENGKKLEFNMGEYSSDLFSDYVNNFMEENKDHPFFVYYPMALTHCPFSPTPDSDDWDPKSRGSKSYKGQAQYFKDMVAYVDKTIAKIDTKLEALDIRDNTLLIFIGDNGTDTPIVTNTTYGKVVGAKGQMIDGGNHVPCIVSWPGVIKQGKVTNDIIDFSDMLPTICDAAGIQLPSDIPFDGVSFLPQLQGQKGNPRDSIFMWYSRNGGEQNARQFARNQEYKLYATGQFYHVPSDLLEKSPLKAADLDKKTLAIKSMLQNKLDEFSKVKYLSSTTGKGPAPKVKKNANKKKGEKKPAA